MSLAACSQRGQLVLGIATDLPARDRIDEVSLEVRRRGETMPIVTHNWDLSGLPAKDWRLPGSFNLYADGGQEPTFDVVVKGLLGGKPRVERRVALGILADEDLFMRLGLIARCEQVGCPPSLSCIDGQCQSTYVPLRALPAYRAELVEKLECSTGTSFIDTSTGEAMPTLGGGCGSGTCSEGICLANLAGLPGADPRPFVGSPTELFATTSPPGAFYPVGPLDADRYAATATRLDDGRVLVVGGFDSAASDGSAVPVPGAVVYEPASARFRRVADPPVSLGGHSATLLDGGLVLFVGAVGSTPAAMLFDPSTDGFVSVPAPSAARYFHTATRLTNQNRVLVAGGSAKNGPGFVPVAGAEVFDPMTRSWSPTSNAPAVPRVFHAAVELPDRRVLLLGGIDAGGAVLGSVEAYDPSLGTFAPEMDLAAPRAHHTATQLDAGPVLLVGGEIDPGASPHEQAELYVTGGTLTPAQPSPAPAGVIDQLAIPLGGDRILFVAGRASSTTNAAAGGAFIYDHAALAFTALPEPSLARYRAFGALLQTGEVLLGGGTGADSNIIDTDGGMPDGPPADLGPASCDPVGTADTVCTGSTPRCTISGTSIFGPFLVSDQGPHCAAAGTIPLGMPCTPGTRDGTKPDDCVSGTVCSRGAAGSPTCVPVCRTDVDCGAQTTLSRCALIGQGGPGMSELGACSTPCTLYAVDDCMIVGGTCRLVLNHPTSGVLEAQGACGEMGQVTVGQTCTQMDNATECSTDNQCMGGLCRYQCASQADCDTFSMGWVCDTLAFGQTNSLGLCL